MIDLGTLRDVPLDRFFRPSVVAFVGLSATKGHPSRLLHKTITNRIRAHGGVVHPVNPKFAEIDGAKCYASVAEIPAEIDLTVITVSNALDVLDDVLASSTKFVMIFGAGFSESGEEGRRREQELAAKFAASSAFLLGPNTTLNSFLPMRDDFEGRSIALISHSGHQGRHIWQAQDLGIPLSHWAPTGNEVDLEFSDFARYFADQPEVGAIAAYVEGFRDGRRLQLVADHALRRGVPIVMCMVGRSEVGRSSAMTHTAHLSGSDVVSAAVLDQYAVQRVDSIDELLYTSAMFARSAPPVAEGVCVYSISGGTLAHLSDLFEVNGISVPPLADRTVERLRELIPDHLRVSNPVDSGGKPSGDERGKAILEAIVEDPGIGVVVIPFVADAHHLSNRMVEDAIEVARTTDKPICVVWGSPTATETAYTRLIGDPKVVTFRTFGQAITALRSYFRYHRARADYRSIGESAIATRAGGDAPPVELVPSDALVLSERDSKALLARYGVRCTRDVLATTPSEAVAAAESIGGPVVLKVSSADIQHKSDLGLVEVGVEQADVAAAADRLLSLARERAPEARVEGILVCELVESGVEALVGVQRDPVFGPVVVCGIGGVLVEVLNDVSFRLPPFDREQARAMVDELRCRVLFDGVRGMPAVDVEALVDVIMAVQGLVLDAGDRIAEIDINPVIVRPDGAVALDALVRLRDPADHACRH